MSFVIVDLENTISDARNRLWLLKSESEDQLLKEEYNRQFQEGFIYDEINMNVKLFMDALHKKGYSIIILTAKDVDYRSVVVEWLDKYDVSYSLLIMKDNDKISDLKFKEKYVSKIKHDVDFALDDVGANCAMFATHNIPCLRIEQK